MLRDSLAIPVATPLAKQLRAMKWSVLDRDRSIPHFSRKFYHFMMGAACFLLYWAVLTRSQALLVVAVAGGIWVAFDVARLRNPKLNATTLRLFGSMMRREELRSLSANSFYILGLLSLVVFFSKTVGLLALICLAVGDPVAAIAGTLYGRRRLFGKKSLEGALANFTVTALFAFVIANAAFSWTLPSAVAIALATGAASMISELMPLPGDDNLTIPLVSAMLLTALTPIFPLLAI